MSAVVHLLRTALMAVLAPAGFVLACAMAHAAGPASAAGYWRTIDDETHRPRAIVEISEQQGVLSGRIVRLFREPGEEPAPRCKECKGERHDQPVLGMTILWNLRRHGDGWEGGEILDPNNGRIYRARVRLNADGERLEVRGFIGFALLGRTQVWERASAADAAPAAR